MPHARPAPRTARRALRRAGRDRRSGRCRRSGPRRPGGFDQAGELRKLGFGRIAPSSSLPVSAARQRRPPASRALGRVPDDEMAGVAQQLRRAELGDQPPPGGQALRPCSAASARWPASNRRVCGDQAQAEGQPGGDIAQRQARPGRRAGKGSGAGSRSVAREASGCDLVGGDMAGIAAAGAAPVRIGIDQGVGEPARCSARRRDRADHAAADHRSRLPLQNRIRYMIPAFNGGSIRDRDEALDGRLSRRDHPVHRRRSGRHRGDAARAHRARRRRRRRPDRPGHLRREQFADAGGEARGAESRGRGGRRPGAAGRRRVRADHRPRRPLRATPRRSAPTG